jgi:hypothetical protein
VKPWLQGMRSAGFDFFTDRAIVTSVDSEAPDNKAIDNLVKGRDRPKRNLAQFELDKVLSEMVNEEDDEKYKNVTVGQFEYYL